MCGRFAYFGNGFFGYESLQLPEPPFFESFNITPSQSILALRTSPESSTIEWTRLHWGLVPFWSKSDKTKFPLINARAEGIETKPSFRSPFRHRRCIIPASGFYEWLHKDGAKQPFFIQPAGGGHFALAGLWEHWQGTDGAVIESCAIITTTANSLMATIHDRMPVILTNENLPAWIDPGTIKEDLLSMLHPCPESMLEAYPVSSRVNNPRNNDSGCIARLD